MQSEFPRCLVKAAINVRGILAEKRPESARNLGRTMSAIKEFNPINSTQCEAKAAWLESAQRREGIARPYSSFSAALRKSLICPQTVAALLMGFVMVGRCMGADAFWVSLNMQTRFGRYTAK